MEEYKIAKSSIQSVMGQLTGVSVGLLGLSIAVVRFGDDFTVEYGRLGVWYMVLVLLNFLLAYLVYQNIQIIALQKHIAGLEERLGEPDVFRWESRIARIWYGAGSLSGVSLNMLIALPPIILLVLVYCGLWQEASKREYCYWAIGLNVCYILFLSCAACAVLRKVKAV